MEWFHNSLATVDAKTADWNYFWGKQNKNPNEWLVLMIQKQFQTFKLEFLQVKL